MLSYLRQAWLSWKSAKTSALLAILALAFGIGSVTAIFTVINTVLLKPIPYQYPERWAALFAGSVRDPESFGSLGIPDLLKFQQRTHSFEVFGWLWFTNVNLTSPGAPQHIEGIEVTPALVNGLGVQPMLGHWFRESNAESAVVISGALWQRLGADANIIGKPVTLNGRVYSVRGVMPAWFRFPLAGPFSVARTDVWLPLDPQGREQRPLTGYFGIGRLKPGVSLAQATADIKQVAAGIVKETSSAHPDFTARLDGLLALFSREIRPTLLLLSAAAGLLMLLTCANVSGLLSARSVARARDTALRVALGASGGQLALQYFLEVFFIGLIGAAAGIVVAIALVRFVVAQTSQLLPRANEIGVDWKVLLFTLGVTLLASVLSSLAPLWQALRTPPNEVLNEGVRASAGARSRKLIYALVVAEIALAFTLLTGSTVLLAQFRKLIRTSPGFVPDSLLTFQVNLADPIATNQARRISVQRALIRAIDAIPGVTSSALANQLPLAGCCMVTSVYPEERQPNFRLESASFIIASPDYIPAMRIPLHRGRLLTDHDTSGEILPVLINQAAARLYWPGRDAIGAFGRVFDEKGARFQVVGVVGDVHSRGMDAAPSPEIYLSSALIPVSNLHFVVRSNRPPNTLAAEVARAVQSVEKDQPIHDIRTMPDIVSESLSLKRVGSVMTTFFAFAALLLASLGVYGVVAYSTRQRTAEIGTRMALGAVPSDLLSLIVGSGLKMAMTGIVIGGVVVIVAVGYLVRAFDIDNVGPIPYLISTATVAGVASLASFFPAWRATLLSPMVAIRNEPSSMWQSAQRSLRRVIESLGSQTEEPVIDVPSLFAGLIHPSRSAASFQEALRTMLDTLSASVGASSAMLLESLSADSFLLRRLRFQSGSLPISDADCDAWLRWARLHRPEYVAEIETLRQSGARIAVPLRTGKEILGVILLTRKHTGSAFGVSARRALDASASQFALMLENARLTGRIVEQEKLGRDLAIAAEVQKRLLPQHVPRSEAATFAATTMPARSIGGDYYDFLSLPGRQIGLAIADVSGKGIAAALITSLVQASLRLISAEPGISLPQLTGKMNRFLKQSVGSNRTSFATFFYAVFDEHSRELRYVNAGHNPPLLVRENEIQKLSTRGYVLGMFANATYEEARTELRSGDVLFTFTDGLTEAMSPSNEEFGEQRLMDLLRELRHLSVDELSSRVSGALRNWTLDAEQHDDITFVVMKVKPRV